MLEKILVNKERIDYISINPIQYIKVSLHKENPLEPVKNYWKAVKTGLFGNIKKKEYVIEFDYNLDKVVTNFEFEYQGHSYSGGDKFETYEIPEGKYTKLVPNELPKVCSSISIFSEGTWISKLNLKLHDLLHGVKYKLVNKCEFSIRVRVNPHLIINLIDGTKLILSYETNKELAESVGKIHQTFQSVRVL